MESQEINIPKVANPAKEAEGSCPTPTEDSDVPCAQEPIPTLPIPPEQQNVKNRPGQFVKGTSGNPNGRPPGSRNKATLLMEAMLEGEAEQLTRKVIELASGGDLQAIRLCLDRLLPPCKDRPIQLSLPRIETLAQISSAMSTLVEAIGDGRITPSDGGKVANILSMQSNFVTGVDLERRVTELEQALRANRKIQ